MENRPVPDAGAGYPSIPSHNLFISQKYNGSTMLDHELTSAACLSYLLLLEVACGTITPLLTDKTCDPVIVGRMT